MATDINSREIGLILVTRILKTEHLHYGFWNDDLEVNLANLPKAQDAYAEYLIGKIPPSVRSILDVGCGTGLLAQMMVARGYEVAGVSPSPYLSELARRRLGSAFELHECTFEELETRRTYDLVLFAESYQHVDSPVALPKILRLLNPGGHALICDFFAREGHRHSTIGGGHRLDVFHAALQSHGYEIVLDEDITARTAPSLKLVDELLQNIASPVWETAGYVLRRKFPILSRIGRLLFGRRLRAIRRKYIAGDRNAQTFAKEKAYRCMLLRRRQPGQPVAVAAPVGLHAAQEAPTPSPSGSGEPSSS
jgi:SAM-dependent methyltransferase